MFVVFGRGSLVRGFLCDVGGCGLVIVACWVWLCCVLGMVVGLIMHLWVACSVS